MRDFTAARVGALAPSGIRKVNEKALAMERAGLRVPAKCRAGGCGFCHSKLVSGKFSLAGADKRRLADAKFGYLHPCCSYPDSDMELIVPKA